jgi:hypothetical protein
LLTDPVNSKEEKEFCPNYVQEFGTSGLGESSMVEYFKAIFFIFHFVAIAVKNNDTYRNVPPEDAVKNV